MNPRSASTLIRLRIILPVVLAVAILVPFLGCQRPHGPFWVLRDIYPVDHDHVWAGGTAGVFYTDDAGNHWRRILPEMGFESQNIGYFNRQRVGHILYASRDRALVSASDGVALITPDGGLIELRAPSPSFWYGLVGVSFVDESHGWAYGGGEPSGKVADFTMDAAGAEACGSFEFSVGSVYRTEDGGKTWQSVAVVSGIGSMVPGSADVLWLTAQCGRLIYTFNRGSTWSVRPVKSGSIVFADQTHAVLSSPSESTGDVFRTLVLPFGDPMLGFTTEGEIWGIATGDQDNNLVRHSTDGGKTWTTINVVLPKTVWASVHSRFPGEAWIAEGDGVAYLVTDNGKTVRQTRVARALAWDWLPYHR
jgi:photosystem II stability/assembly factor-like uncharacterized protein